MAVELLEVLLEAARYVLGGHVVSLLIRPGGLRLQHFRRNAWARLRHEQAEVRVGHELALAQNTVEHGLQHGAGVGDLHAVADAVAAARPAGVHQPAIGAVLVHQLTEQFRVDGGVTRHERAAEAARERGLRLLHALFGAGDARGVAGQEVVHRLFRRQLGDRRQHAECIGGQHHDILRVRALAGFRRVRNELQRIGRAGVFGQRAIVQVQRALDRIHHDVLEDGAEALGGRVDLRLGFLGQVDHLRVAAAFEVEQAVRAPAVLVVTDQGARGVGGQGGLARAGQAEENSAFAIRSDVGGAVHRHHALFGQVVVQEREHRLLHFAGVNGAADDDDLLGEVQDDEAFGVGAVDLRVGLHVRRVKDGEVRIEAGQRRFGRLNEHVGGEQIVPGLLVHDARLETVGVVGTGVDVADVDVLARQVLQHLGVQLVEGLRRHADVDLAPVHRCLSGLVAHDEFVVRRAAGVLTRQADEGAVLGELAVTVLDGVFDEFGPAEVPEHIAGRLQAVLLETD